jgi:hypothetical protein
MIGHFRVGEAVALLLIFVPAGMLCQTISPCVTACLTSFCADGVSDTPCFCVGEKHNIEHCINITCDKAAIGNAQSIFSNFCKTLPTSLNDRGPVSSTASPSAGASAASSTGTVARHAKLITWQDQNLCQLNNNKATHLLGKLKVPG